MHIAQGMWWECAVPAMMQKWTNVKERRVGLCMSWWYKRHERQTQNDTRVRMYGATKTK
jgi:hypothetical protein